MMTKENSNKRELSLGTQLLTELNDASAFAKTYNQDHKKIYWGDKVDKRFPLITAISYTAGGALLGYFVLDKGIGMLAGSAIGYLIHLSRIPNILFGGNRFYGNMRNQQQNKEVYYMGKIVKRYKNAKEIVEQLKKTEDMTVPQNAICLAVIDRTIKYLKEINNRNEKRNKRDFYKKNGEKMDESKDDEKRLRKLAETFEKRRRDHIDDKWRRLSASSRAKRDRTNLFGKKKQILNNSSENENAKDTEETQRNQDQPKFISKSRLFKLDLNTGLYVPVDDVTKQSNEKENDHWDPEVVEFINKHYKNEDVVRKLLDVMTELREEIENLPVKSKQLPPSPSRRVPPSRSYRDSITIIGRRRGRRRGEEDRTASAS